MTDGRYLVFAVTDQKYALAVEDVAEIMNLPALYPLPKAPAYYRGLMNCHGRPIPVLDLATLYKRVPLDKGGKILVLEGKTVTLALLVQRVIGIVSGLHSAEQEDGGDYGVETSLSGDDGTIRLIEPEKLLERLEAEING